MQPYSLCVGIILAAAASPFSASLCGNVPLAEDEYVVQMRGPLPGIPGISNNLGLELWGWKAPILAWNSRSGQRRILRTPECSFSKMALSSQGLIAVLERRDSPTVGGCSDRDLYVLDLNGTTIAHLGEPGYAIDFAWSPDGRQLAYLCCVPPGDMETLCTGNQVLFIHDSETGQTDAVSTGGLALYWARFDECIYVYLPDQPEGEQVYRYKPSTQEKEWTPYHNVWFSPSEERYFDKGYDYVGAFSLFERETNANVKDDPYCVIAPVVWSALAPEQWLSPQHLLLLQAYHGSLSKPRHSFILNVNTGELRRTESRILAATDTDNEFVVVTASNNLAVEALLDMAVVPPGELRALLHEK